MWIISRYLLKLHVAPFLFALGALTGIMLVNQIARRFGELVGKGLPWTVIVEVFALSVPFLMATTLPMAVLVAVLYAFGRLTADNEITALRAGGVSTGRLMIPLLTAGVALSIVAFLFSDHILPRSNHRLRTLLMDIQRKKPTFFLKEQVINEIQRNRLFLRAARIDQMTFRLRDVTIYDLADQYRKRIIYADSGQMALTPNLADLQLTLYDGSLHEFDRADPQMFQNVDFRQDIVVVPDVGNELRRTTNDTFKGDREMGVCEMESVIIAARRQAQLSERRAAAIGRNGLRALVGLAPLRPDTIMPAAAGSVYCRLLRSSFGWILPEALRAQSQRHDSVPRTLLKGFNETAQTAFTTGTMPRARISEVRSLENRARSHRTRAVAYLTEVHKKYAIAAACVVFVLIGVPTAMRFPRGGVGLVVGASLTVFTVYYIGLIGGEALADRMVVSPFWAMWTPNIIFAFVSLILLYQNRTAATTTRAADHFLYRERLRQAWSRVRLLLR